MYAGLRNPSGTAARRQVTAGASPWTYTNSNAVPERVVIGVGTISLIELQCDGATFDSVIGATGGWYLLNPSDSLRITWVTITPIINVCPF